MRLDVETLQQQVSEPHSAGQLFLERGNGNAQEIKEKIYAESQRERTDGVGPNFGLLEVTASSYHLDDLVFFLYSSYHAPLLLITL